MQCNICRSGYHEDHGCGVAVMTGTAYAEHSISCSKGVNWSNEGGFFKKSKPGEYLPWEAPGGECPHCYHVKLDDVLHLLEEQKGKTK